MRLVLLGANHRTTRFRAAWAACMLALCAAGLTAGAREARGAEPAGKAKVKLVVGEPDSSKEQGDADFERKKLEEVTDIVAKRVRKRLETAAIKQFTVTVDKPSTVHVSALGGVSHALLAGIVVPQGDFELRPAMPIGAHWTRHAGELPEGVEIHQEKGSFSAAEAYLWSQSRRTLTKAVEAVAPEGYLVKTYPADDGWRTLALGEPVATHDDVARARIRQGKMGERYVRVMFAHDVVAELPHRIRRTWAVVLDGEVVSAFGRADEDFGSAMSITAPDNLTSPEARRAWAQQVAGRLAAHISVPVVEMTDD